jgi:2-oxoglutarate ferredoxin oxidoreductase subunit gamma
MLTKTIFAGFGGQGVLSMGLSLAQAAMQEGKYVTYLPSYGAEVRGGTANCTVAVSDEEIASPVASSPEFVVAMNHPSLVRFQNQLQSGGVLFANSSLVEADAITRGDIDVVSIPANGIAEELGSPKSNVVALASIVEELSNTFKNRRKLVAINERALEAGYRLS